MGIATVGMGIATVGMGIVTEFLFNNLNMYDNIFCTLKC